MTAKHILKLVKAKESMGMVVLVDKKPRPLYRMGSSVTDDGVFKLDDRLVHSVVFDDFYTKGVDKEQVRLLSRRRGRNVELILSEPFFVKGFSRIPFYVLTFKGAGAKIYEESETSPFIINPLEWPSDDIIECGRIWGGLDKEFASGEAENSIFSDRNVFHTPYVAQNQVPIEVQRQIYERSGRVKKEDDPNLHQIARLSMTNIRFNDFCLFNKDEVKYFAQLALQAGWTLEKLAKHLGKVDGRLVSEALKLNAKRQFFNFHPRGILSDNRYVTGEITDLEQAVISKYGEQLDCWPWSIDVMCQSKRVLKNLAESLEESYKDVHELYFNIVSEVTGFRFTQGQNGGENDENQNHYSEYLKYRAQVMKTPK